MKYLLNRLLYETYLITLNIKLHAVGFIKKLLKLTNICDRDLHRA